MIALLEIIAANVYRSPSTHQAAGGGFYNTSSSISSPAYVKKALSVTLLYR